VLRGTQVALDLSDVTAASHDVSDAGAYDKENDDEASDGEGAEESAALAFSAESSLESFDEKLQVHSAESWIFQWNRRGDLYHFP
jgi:hypothetical protein